MISIGITDHLEGPRERPSADVYAEVADLVREADRLGVRYAWFAEHHGHAHQGHCPTPLLFALKIAGETRQIRLGTAIVCLNLHHPLGVAEQMAVADVLMDRRLAPGFGSGSAVEEPAMFGVADCDEGTRHARFEEAVRIILAAWRGNVSGEKLKYCNVGGHQPLPVAAMDLPDRSWQAVNSIGAAQIAGRLNLNVLFSHLRTPEQYRTYRQAYAEAGGRRLIAANRPVFVGRSDAPAFEAAEPALRMLWRRFKAEGKISGDIDEPADVRALCGHPINFIVGSRETVLRELHRLRSECPFDVANLEVRWAGLSHEQVMGSLRCLMEP